jgi:hypothetical protein
MVLGLQVEDRGRPGTSTITLVRLPVEMWNLGPRFVYRYRGADPLIGVVVDPTSALPDVNRANNRWSR